MADQHHRRSELLARRERKRREIRRRRRVALGGVLGGAAATVALVAVIVAMAGGSGGGAGDSNRDGAHGGLVRNARPQPGWVRYTGAVPIIEYHVLGAAPEGARFPELFVSRPDFHQQMDWLDDEGFEAVTLEQVERAWYQDGRLPPKPVVVSFDDGYRPQYTYALPELRRHGWAGVLNLKAEGSDLYRSNVEEMIGAGWELASHTIDHSDLSQLDGEALSREVAESRRILRREYDVPVSNFCYPAGRFDDAVVAAVVAAGYTAATTEVPGYAERGAPFRLARLEILGSTGVEGLAGMLADSEG